MNKGELQYLVGQVYKEAREIEISVNRGKTNLKEATQNALSLVAKLAMVVNEIIEKEKSDVRKS